MPDSSTLSCDPVHTHNFGRELGAELIPNSVVLLFGALGCGKTTLVKGIAEGASNIPGREVNSPTFTYLNIYATSSAIPFYHFDLYRLRSQEDFVALGFDTYLEAGGICCIEWPERISSLISRFSMKNTVEIHLSYVDAEKRLLSIKR